MDKKPFENYDVEDFVTDESFLNYFFDANEKDARFWKNWIENNPGKSQLVDEAIQFIQSMTFSLDKNSFAREYRKIEIGINEKSPFTIKRFMNWNRVSDLEPKRRRRGTYLLAVLLILLSATFFYNKQNSSRIMAANHVVTSLDSSLVLTLSDSTVVTLLAHSSLEYPESFEGKNRDVFLKGQANFHVKRNEHFPFKVHTKDIVTTVLGTIFNIKKSGDSAIVVEVLKGKVKVNAAAQPELSVFVFPHEKAVFVKNGNHLYKSQMEAPLKNLAFKKSDFKEIAAEIKDTYGVTLINESNKKNFHFTGEFKNSSAKEIVENICLIENLSFEVHGDTILIK
ncbi:MAG: FecR family protein [Ginsengibacter sp.]